MSGTFPWYVARASGLVGWALLAAATLWGLALSTKVLGKRPRPELAPRHAPLARRHRARFTGVHVRRAARRSVRALRPDRDPRPVRVEVASGRGRVGRRRRSTCCSRSSSRRWRGPASRSRSWRRVHFASFVLFVTATIHGLTAGTDTQDRRWPRVVVARRGYRLRRAHRAARIAESVRAPRRAPRRDRARQRRSREMLGARAGGKRQHDDRPGAGRRRRRARARRRRARAALRGLRRAHRGRRQRRARCTSSTIEPDVIVLDVLMPGTDGLEVCRRLRERGDRTPVLMLTARHEVTDRVAGLDAGADDYLVKPFALDELLARLRALLRRTSITGDGRRAARSATSRSTRSGARRGAATRELGLTKTEFDLLELLLVNANIVVTRDTIYERIWGYEFETSSKSLDVYIGYLRRKTEADGEPRLIRTSAASATRCARHEPAPPADARRRGHVRARRRRLHVRRAREREPPAPLGDRRVPAAALDAGSRTRRPDEFPHGGQRRRRRPAAGRRPRARRPRRGHADPRRAAATVVSSITGQPAAADRRERSRARAERRPAHDSATSRSATTRTGCSPSRCPAAARCRSRAASKPTTTCSRSLDARLLLIALVGTLVAASLAWADRPPHRAADRAAHHDRHATSPTTQDLDNPIEVDRRDEIGRLASSFNTHARRAAHVARAAAAARDGREPRAAHAAHRAAHEHRPAAAGAHRSTPSSATSSSARPTSSSASSPTSSSELVELATDTRTEEPVRADRPRRARRAGRDPPAAPHRARRSRSSSNDPRRSTAASRCSNARSSNLRRQRAEVQPGRHARSKSSCDGARRRGARPRRGHRRRRPPARVRSLLPVDRRRARVPGSGLGLAIVEQIAELHGGTVTLAPRVGGGDRRAPRRCRGAADSGQRRRRTERSADGRDRARGVRAHVVGSSFASAAVVYRAAPSSIPARAKPGATTSATYSGVGTGSCS